MQLHAIKPHLHAMALRVVRNRAIGGKQRKLSVAASVLVKRLDHATPGFMLAVVDLAEIQHLALHLLPSHAAAVLNNIPVPMFLAVFEASVEAQNMMRIKLRHLQMAQKVLGLHYRRFAISPPCSDSHFCPRTRPNSPFDSPS